MPLLKNASEECKTGETPKNQEGDRRKRTAHDAGLALPDGKREKVDVRPPSQAQAGDDANMTDASTEAGGDAQPTAPTTENSAKSVNQMAAPKEQVAPEQVTPKVTSPAPPPKTEHQAAHQGQAVSLAAGHYRVTITASSPPLGSPRRMRSPTPEQREVEPIVADTNPDATLDDLKKVLAKAQNNSISVKDLSREIGSFKGNRKVSFDMAIDLARCNKRNVIEALKTTMAEAASFLEESVTALERYKIELDEKMAETVEMDGARKNAKSEKTALEKKMLQQVLGLSANIRDLEATIKANSTEQSKLAESIKATESNIATAEDKKATSQRRLESGAWRSEAEAELGAVIAQKKEYDSNIGKLEEVYERLRADWTNWDVDSIINWIVGLEDGRFKNYQETIKAELERRNMSGKSLVKIGKNVRMVETFLNVTDFDDQTDLYDHIVKLTKCDTNEKD